METNEKLKTIEAEVMKKMETKYCSCGYPILVGTRWNGLAHVLVFRDGRTGAEIGECPGCGESRTAWLWLPPGCENLHLRPGALLDKPPKDWTWWTPDNRDNRCLTVLNDKGEVVHSAIVPAEVVVCDLCNATIETRPVPVFWDGYAACERCFREISGLSLEEAAQRDGIVLFVVEAEA